MIAVAFQPSIKWRPDQILAGFKINGKDITQGVHYIIHDSNSAITFIFHRKVYGREIEQTRSVAHLTTSPRKYSEERNMVALSSRLSDLSLVILKRQFCNVIVGIM